MLVSEITAFLEQAYEVLNEHYFEGVLPPVVITIQSSPRAYGHYTTWDAWVGDKGYREINLGAENLDRPIQCIIATLLHEMVHHYCAISGIKDTSRGGVYHNKRFKEEARQRDLHIEYDPRIGHSITTPTYALTAFVDTQDWGRIDLSRTGGHSSSGGGPDGSNGADAGSDTTTGRKKSSTRKYICPSCGCSVRATKSVNIGCLDCSCQMVVEEK